MYGRQRIKNCVSEPLGKRKRKWEEESISDCESSDSNYRIVCKRASMPMVHVVKLLDIVARERRLVKLEMSMQSIQKELCSEVNAQYDYATVAREYERQYLLYRTFLRLQAHGFTFNQETKFLEATETQWNLQLSIDSIVAQLRDVKLTIVDKWEEVFDKMPITQNTPKLLKQNVHGKELMKWYSGGSSRSNSRRYHPYNVEVDSIKSPLDRCITRLRSFNNLPSTSYVEAVNAMIEHKDIPRWLCDEPDDMFLEWVVYKTPIEKRGQMEAFLENWKLEKQFSQMVASTHFSQ